MVIVIVFYSLLMHFVGRWRSHWACGRRPPGQLKKMETHFQLASVNRCWYTDAGHRHPANWSQRASCCAWRSQFWQIIFGERACRHEGLGHLGSGSPLSKIVGIIWEILFHGQKVWYCEHISLSLFVLIPVWCSWNTVGSCLSSTPRKFKNWEQCLSK